MILNMQPRSLRTISSVNKALTEPRSPHDGDRYYMKRRKDLREPASTDLWQVLHDVWNNISAKFLKKFYFKRYLFQFFFIHLYCFNYMQVLPLCDLYGEPMFDTQCVWTRSLRSNTGKGGLTCSWLGEGFDNHTRQEEKPAGYNFI